jgi:hypothetical protein
MLRIRSASFPELSWYRTDRKGIVTDVDVGWVRSALANDEPELGTGAVGLSIWDSMAGDETRQIYEHLLHRAARKGPVEFDYRCDGPTVSRWLMMRIKALGPGKGFEFRSVLMRERGDRDRAGARPPGPEAPVCLCSWCTAAETEDTWAPIDELLARGSSARASAGASRTASARTAPSGCSSPRRPSLAARTHRSGRTQSPRRRSARSAPPQGVRAVAHALPQLVGPPLQIRRAAVTRPPRVPPLRPLHGAIALMALCCPHARACP